LQDRKALPYVEKGKKGKKGPAASLYAGMPVWEGWGVPAAVKRKRERPKERT